MYVYHLTKKSDLGPMRENGINPHSFWGDFQIVISLLSNQDKAIIIRANTDDYKFVINYEVAELMNKNGQMKGIPEESDFISGFRFCNGLICEEKIFDFEVIEKEEYNNLFNEALEFKS